MASPRKKYQAQVEERKDTPVAAAPTQAAEPPPVTDKQPAEQPTESNPVEEAAKSALRQRLQEVERADQLNRQQPRYVAEPQQPVDPIEQAIASLPERMKRWYQTHPEFLTDPEKSAQMQYAHWVARREVGEEFTEPYFDRMEQMLGFKQEQRPPQQPPQQPQQANYAPARNLNGDSERMAAPRPAAPMNVARQASAVPVSAPPTRDAPSMTTGRAPSEPMRLTNEELELARTLKLSPQEYAEGKKRMLREKGEGYHTDAGR